MRLIKRLTAAAVVLAIVVGLGFYLRPLWFTDQAIRLAMWHNGAHSRFVGLPEGRIHFYDIPQTTGPGTPLLLVHGLGGRSQDFAPLIPRLTAAGFHVYAPDLLGYGDSDKPATSDFSIAAEEQVLTNFMDAIHLPHAVVVGWSMGGWITLRLAVDHPERVDRIAVYDAVGIAFQTDADTPLFTPTDSAGVAKLIRTMSPTMKVPPAFAQRDLIRKLAQERWVIDRSVRSMKTGRDIVDAKLAGMQPPLLLIYGVQDVLTPPSVGQRMHTLDPRSVFAAVEGCGHFGPIECAGTYARLTINFFQSNPAMPPAELHFSR